MYGRVCAMGNNYDRAWGAKPWGHYHNSLWIFLVARTCPYINTFITQRNSKMNPDRDADGLFSSALPLTCSDSSLSSSLSTMYEKGKPRDKRWWTAHLNLLVSNSLQQHPVQEPPAIFTHVQMCYKHNRPCYECDRPCFEHHTPVMSIMPLLRVSHPPMNLWRLAIPNTAHVVPLKCAVRWRLSHGFPISYIVNRPLDTVLLECVRGRGLRTAHQRFSQCSSYSFPKQ